MSTGTPDGKRGAWRSARLGAAALGVLVATVWIWNAFEQGRALDSSLEALRYELEFKQDLAANLDANKARLADLRRRLAEAVRELPSRFDAVALRRDLDALAAKHGVELADAVPGKEVVKAFHAELPVDVALRGAPGSIYAFVEDLASHAPAKNLRALKLEANAGGSASDAALRMTYYRYAEEL